MANEKFSDAGWAETLVDGADSVVGLKGGQNARWLWSAALTYISANLDATLVAVAGVTFAANKGLYSTGADAFATYDLTAGGRALGGVAGTADTFPYFSASNVATLGTITAGGRALLALTGASNKIPYLTGSGTAALADYEMVTANTSHTPVLAGSTGGTPTASTNTCTFLRNGSVIDVDIQISAITLNGATGNMTLTMPFTASRSRVFILEEYVAVGFSVAGFMSTGSNVLTLKKLSDNSSVLVAGYGFRGGGSFRA